MVSYLLPQSSWLTLQDGAVRRSNLARDRESRASSHQRAEARQMKSGGLGAVRGSGEPTTRGHRRQDLGFGRRGIQNPGQYCRLLAGIAPLAKRRPAVCHRTMALAHGREARQTLCGYLLSKAKLEGTSVRHAWRLASMCPRVRTPGGRTKRGVHGRGQSTGYRDPENGASHSRGESGLQVGSPPKGGPGITLQ